MNSLVLEKHKTLGNNVATLPVSAAFNRLRPKDFDSLSKNLDSSYQELEHLISRLQVQLEQADRQRIQEFDAREKLANRLDLVLDVMPTAVILLDGRGRVSRANSAAEQLLGCPLQDERWIDVIAHCFAPAPADGHEVLLRNGRLVSLATQSLRTEAGQIIVLSDQTETRRLQDKLNHHRNLSEMGRMTASLAHQIRTPLSSAILYADNLVNPALSEEKKQHYVGRIRNQLNLLEKQVRDILIFSRGGLVLEKTLSCAELADLLEKSLGDISQLDLVQCSVNKSTLSGYVRCNPELLLSAFNNLVENSIQACKQAKISLELNFNVSQNPQSTLVIYLHDNGPGIPQDQEDRILEPFYTTKATGTGLGLAVVAAIVQGHGGSFSLRNSLAGGAVAIITLPVLPQI